MWPPIRVGRVEVWNKVGGTNVSSFFLFSLACRGIRGEHHSWLTNYISTQGCGTVI